MQHHFLKLSLPLTSPPDVTRLSVLGGEEATKRCVRLSGRRDLWQVQAAFLPEPRRRQEGKTGFHPGWYLSVEFTL